MHHNINMYKTVCEAPSGNGFCIEHMPDFLLDTGFDDCCPHVHSFYEILWFTEGTGTHTVDFADYEITPNTIFFLTPGQIHHFDHCTDYRGVSIKMCSDFMKNEDGTNSMILKYNVFHSFDTTPCYKIEDECATELNNLVKAMEKESNVSNVFGNIDILQSLLRIFLVKIQRHGIQESNFQLDAFKPSHLLFINFRRMVEKEYTHMHSVQEYAAKLNVAVRTLNKCVNDCSHMSPLTFINDRILLEAKRMVRYTNLMIKEIALDLGYDEPSYFVKFFKRQTGYLPSEFRELDEVTHCKLQV